MEQNDVTVTLCRGWRGGVVVRALDLSGVAVAMRHRLQWFIHLRAHGLRKGDEQPAYTPHVVWHSFTFMACKLDHWLL